MSKSNKKIIITVEPKETYTANLLEPSNYFRVQNGGQGEIFCGVNNMPTKLLYDFAVYPKSSSFHCEQRTFTRIYLYNDSNYPCQILLTYFQAPFEATALAVGTIQDGREQANVNVNFTGFTDPLPQGNNKIGKVEVVNHDQLVTKVDSVLTELTTVKNKIGGELAEGDNKIGKVEVIDKAVTDAKLDIVINKLNYIVDNWGSGGSGGGGGGGGGVTSPTPTPVPQPNQNLFYKFSPVSSTETNVFLIEPIKKLVFISNDGNADITITLNNTTFVLKSKETLNDIDIKVTSLKFKANGNSSIRIMGVY